MDNPIQGPVVVLTGAGISAESGVPTFRGKGGLWRNFKPQELATPEAFRRDPALPSPQLCRWDETPRIELHGAAGS